MMSAVVCADGGILEFADVATAIAAALDLIRLEPHAHVGVHIDAGGAARMAARAYPGMVVCPRIAAFGDVDCYPLSESTALVRSSSSRSPVARTLRSATPRARPFAPTTT
jgi:hypothetical protein